MNFGVICHPDSSDPTLLEMFGITELPCLMVTCTRISVVTHHHGRVSEELESILDSSKSK